MRRTIESAGSSANGIESPSVSQKSSGWLIASSSVSTGIRPARPVGRASTGRPRRRRACRRAGDPPGLRPRRASPRADRQRLERGPAGRTGNRFSLQFAFDLKRLLTGGTSKFHSFDSGQSIELKWPRSPRPQRPRSWANRLAGSLAGAWRITAANAGETSPLKDSNIGRLLCRMLDKHGRRRRVLKGPPSGQQSHTP